MNDIEMKLIIPPTVGILVAGVASGICFFLIGSFRKGKSSKSEVRDDSRCACCLKPFLVGRGVECNDCGARSCRKACCRWDSLENSWFCLFCYHSRTWSKRREKWFRSFGGLPIEPEINKNFSTAKSQVYDEGVEHVAVHTELDLATNAHKEGNSMETVREFVEKIVEGLVGNVDDTPIDRLYDHPAYDQLFERYNEILVGILTRLAVTLTRCIDNKPATDTPTMAHTALRELVERAVDEARKLPCLGPTVSTDLHEDPTFSQKNYEDLLATAILNKVIEKFQSEGIDGNSNVVHRRVRTKYTNHDNENGLDEGVDEGSSSLEPLSQDECSSEGSGPRTRRTRVRKEPLSLTIEEQIEEVTTTFGSDEELLTSKTNVLDFRNSRRVPFPELGMDIVDPSQDSSDESQEEIDLAPIDLITPVESWEENWLFQKRKIRTQSEPVSMLVPNPSADYRALIGDRDAEDTSDLSEFSAQSEEESDEDDVIEAINRSVPKSSKLEATMRKNAEVYWPEGKLEKLEKSLSNFSSEIPARDIADRSPKIEDEKVITERSHDPELFSSPEKNSDGPKALSGRDEKSGENHALQEPIDERPSEAEISREKLEGKKSKDNIAEEKNLSSRDVNENLESSTMNGCREDVSQDRLEIKNSDECDSRKEEKSSIEETKTSHEPVEIVRLERPASQESKSEASPPASAKADEEKSSSKNETEDQIELATPPRPGTIAEREHKKWENAAPIENNPYSEENIQKRLLERQYARRSSSDVSGNSTKLPTSPSPPLQIVLGAGRPDFKRFGRDYYINESKFPNGRGIETGFYAASASRPNSALSQNSLSTGSDYEHQERSRSVETESTCSTSSDSRGKADFRVEISREDGRRSLSDVSQNSYDEMLESERKNAKNEINARLNNRGSYDENSRPIRRIDLRAYGFENEFRTRDDENLSRRNRVVNKLDLRSFGYDSGLRRTQSNNNIDFRSKMNVSQQRLRANSSFDEKSNLIEKNGKIFSTGTRDDFFSKSTESLNEETSREQDGFARIKSAKSVPNIDQLCSGFDEKHRESESRCIQSRENGKATTVAENAALPSVKKLARAFDKTEETHVLVRKPPKSMNNSAKERATTPEIHIVDTPRQMHSLTARSISREFREGLRQIASKQTTNSSANKVQEARSSELGTSQEKNEEDAGLVGRGKLKSNIRFWEEMQRQS